MQFKHPELLYALFLLLIPIIIHLFQLRKFQKVDFTNVAFLKKVTIQTRKSSQLKKWLTLLMRLLALASIIIAFAQPFTASKTALNTNKETVLYIDNSFSMQAKGNKGPLLQRAIQDIYAQPNNDEKISWFTNNFSKKNASIQDFKNEILKIPFTQTQLSPEEIILKANQLFSKDAGVDKRLIVVSDFQQNGTFPDKDDNFTLNAVQLKPINTANIAIDTAYIETKKAANIQLKVKVSGIGDIQTSVPVSLYNGEVLIAKTAVDFSENKENTITFDIENIEGFKGRIEIIDPNLSFDNTLFFTVNAAKKIKVLSINEANSSYLQRLFEQPEFDYSQQTFNDLNYNDIPTQNFIILNEVKDIPASLSTSLKSFSDNGGSLLIIPSNKLTINSYNTLLNSFQLGNIAEVIENEKKITQIIFDHPLYKDVFEKRVVNFQYPKVNNYISISSNASAPLKYEDGSPFILQRGNLYFVTAAINTENSNFQSSPLIVPTLYNMALQSLPLPKLYYTIGDQNVFAVSIDLKQDEILNFKDETQTFIPLQQTKANQVNITTIVEPSIANTYRIEKDNKLIEFVSYNYNRKESALYYANPEDWNGIELYNSVEDLFSTITEANTINSFWKWFVIFALLFLILEMLILKFYK